MAGRKWVAISVGGAVGLGVLALVVVVVTRGADGVARTLREGDAGALVEMSVAQQVVVKLEGNPTTGYAWEVAQISGPAVAQAGDPDYESESDADGSGGTFTFRFEAVAPGSAEVVMLYRRSWEDETPAARFTFRVLVS